MMLVSHSASGPSAFDLLDAADASEADSTLIRHVRYDERAQTLEVTFESGAVYHYLHVPEPVKDGLIVADSREAYFNASVLGAYPYRRLR